MQKNHHFDSTKQVIFQSTIVAGLLSLGSAFFLDFTDYKMFWQSLLEQARLFQ